MPSPLGVSRRPSPYSHYTNGQTSKLESLVAMSVSLNQACKDCETAETNCHDIGEICVVPVRPCGLDDVYPREVVRVTEVSGEVVEEVDRDAAELE